MKDIKQEKGITLIALVITIIVLLILAGVAISMLSGENGVLNSAVDAKTKTEEASTKEQLELAINSALTEGEGKIDINTLNSEVKKLTGEEFNIESLPTIVTINGKEYAILEDGKTRVANEIDKLKDSGKPITEDKLTLKDENGHKITIPKILI